MGPHGLLRYKRLNGTWALSIITDILGNMGSVTTNRIAGWVEGGGRGWAWRDTWRRRRVLQDITTYRKSSGLLSRGRLLSEFDDVILRPIQLEPQTEFKNRLTPLQTISAAVSFASVACDSVALVDTPTVIGIIEMRTKQGCAPCCSEPRPYQACRA